MLRLFFLPFLVLALPVFVGAVSLPEKGVSPPKREQIEPSADQIINPWRLDPKFNLEHLFKVRCYLLNNPNELEIQYGSGPSNQDNLWLLFEIDEEARERWVSWASMPCSKAPEYRDPELRIDLDRLDPSNPSLGFSNVYAGEHEEEIRSVITEAYAKRQRLWKDLLGTREELQKRYDSFFLRRPRYALGLEEKRQVSELFDEIIYFINQAHIEDSNICADFDNTIRDLKLPSEIPVQSYVKPHFLGAFYPALVGYSFQLGCNFQQNVNEDPKDQIAKDFYKTKALIKDEHFGDLPALTEENAIYLHELGLQKPFEHLKTKAFLEGRLFDITYDFNDLYDIALRDKLESNNILHENNMRVIQTAVSDLCEIKLSSVREPFMNSEPAFYMIQRHSRSYYELENMDQVKGSHSCPKFLTGPARFTYFELYKLSLENEVSRLKIENVLLSDFTALLERLLQDTDDEESDRHSDEQINQDDQYIREQWKSKQDDRRAKNERQRLDREAQNKDIERYLELSNRVYDTKKIVKYMDYPGRRLDIVNSAEEVLEVSANELRLNDLEESTWALDLAEGLLDLATSSLPGVSWGRDIYETISGKDLISGEELSTFSRTMAIVGVVSGGAFGEKLGKAIEFSKKIMKYNGRIESEAKAIKAAKEVYNFIGDIKYVSPLKSGSLPEHIVDTFRSGTYLEIKTNKPVSLYRVWGHGAEEMGSYWTLTKPSGPLQAQLDAAISPKWPNSMTKWAKIEVPAGQTIYLGVASEVAVKTKDTHRHVGSLIGGGNQVFLRDRPPVSWQPKDGGRGDF